jgi:hypothetical protein
MNPLPFVVLIASVGYFASSIHRTISQEKDEPRLRFRAIISALDSVSANGAQGAQKKAEGLYLFWPRGHIGSVKYDGGIATYIKAIESTLSFEITTYMYVKGGDSTPRWQKADQFSCTSIDFTQRITHALGLTYAAKVKLLKSQGTESPSFPPVH